VASPAPFRRTPIKSARGVGFGGGVGVAYIWSLAVGFIKNQLHGVRIATKTCRQITVYSTLHPPNPLFFLEPPLKATPLVISIWLPLCGSLHRKKYIMRTACKNIFILHEFAISDLINLYFYSMPPFLLSFI